MIVWLPLTNITGAAAVLACGLLVPYLAACDMPSDVRADMIDVSLVAQKQSWQASYLLSQTSGRDSEVPTGREVHVPVGAFVRLRLASTDFVSDFRISELKLRDFAAPGLSSELVFHANKPGRFEVRGEELCGRPHMDRTRGWLVVEDSGAFQAWVRKQARRGRG